MPDSLLKQRLPVVILLVVIAVITVIDWTSNLQRFMMVPAEVVQAVENFRAGDYSRETLVCLSTTLTAGFLHGDASHLFGNALFLWLFGVVVSELCGWRWMLAAFLVTAIGGSVGQILLNPESPIPVLGASGGLMGLMGFYFGLAFQRTRPPSHVWPLARPVDSSQLAAAGVVSVALDFMGIADGNQGIAYGAHIGGFITGIMLSTLADRFVRSPKS